MFRTKIKETSKKANQKVKICGWVQRRRNLGKIVFLTLRDQSGLVQVVAAPQDLDSESQKTLEKIRHEFVISIEGQVNQRPQSQINKEMETGSVEILAQKITILNESLTPPFEIGNEEKQAKEELRLQYRYLDLRQERMKKNIMARSQVIHAIRNFLNKKGFTEIQTPILSKSTPEGARDYLVPSRVHSGKFFALPQAPQQYKQMLMIAGIEKYFQIAPCFRDEDARADRSPGEFYQIDMEMSFVEQEEILDITEEMFKKIISQLFPEKKITSSPWPRLDYEEVIKKYKTDKPDLRKDKEDPQELAFAWILNFPLLVQQEQQKEKFVGIKSKWAPSHNMFTRPQEKDLSLLDTDPGQVKSYQHDLVLNGIEVGGGAMRIHQAKLQEKIFKLIGLEEEQKKEFSHFLRALKYGAPPHGGIAPGLDRLLSVLLNEKNIRETIAFPLTSDARDPLMDAPSKVDPQQLKELGIIIKKK
ncbi:aspartate--tRNA ligase [Patescibacteria group bacterium]|nr:aspartate--tRNA ligase [Patescibacteria group bacterium]